MIKSKQIEFYSGAFGKKYTDRNPRTLEDQNNFCLNTWGKTKIEMNNDFIGSFSKDIKIMEVDIYETNFN